MGESISAKRNEVSIPTFSNLSEGYQAALKVINDIVLKSYVSKLSNMEVVPLNQVVLESNLKENVLFFKINEMVYEKEEFAVYKFASVYNALSMTDSAVFLMIDSDGNKTDFYMGVRSCDEYRTTSSLKNTVENAMKGQFPGIKTENFTIEEMEEILSHIKSNSISAVTCVANSKSRDDSKNQGFVQGLEKFVLSMQGEKYTAIIIANGTTQKQLRALRKGYEAIYTQLSAFANVQINYTNSSSLNYSKTESMGRSIAKSYADNYSNTIGKTKTSGTSYTYGESEDNVESKALQGVASAASLLGAALYPLTDGVSLAVGGVVAGGIGMIASAARKTESTSKTVSQSVAETSSATKGSSHGVTNTENFGASNTEGHTNGNSEGMTLTLHDKTVEDIMERIDRQLKRIDEFESLGMYECAAYFLSRDQYTAEVAASTYKALMRGENSGIEISAINSWGQYQKQKTQLISQYVKNFIHPVFKYQGIFGGIEVTPCALVSGNELAIHMGLPRRSVCGLPVIEHADFGKEVVLYDESKQGAGIKLGNIFNMGSESNNKVTLNIDSLCMHTFITGSTGSGKSNTIYEIIRQLDNFGMNYLIIEPAKGEYKNIFGQSPEVIVLGTNPNITELFRINPFKFPKGIHVLEHIDRLVEIFNVCWPMYAAMPAVLKEAILQAYQDCGWDLSESTNNYSEELFPTFVDLLNELAVVIQNSAYSEEVKGNYTGSLITRIKSLTNGLNGQIFGANEIDNSILFDRKVLVDISRVGSGETKALIMGVLIMRLNEYRMAQNQGMNLPLRHVTVLEEAHNILKRTSTEQNEEGANVAGKSVEMISNAIAEMRTYGEGFIIADQSPSTVDISAIKNTNTKIIMRLPDEQDRRLSGKAAGLKDGQLDEIAKLPKGVAVVYQNDWVEPVLCKIGKFRGAEVPYIRKKQNTLSGNNGSLILLQNLLKKVEGERLDLNIGELSKIVVNESIPSKIKIKGLQVLRKSGICTSAEIAPVIYDLICTPAMEKEAEGADSIEDWKNIFLCASRFNLQAFDEADQNTILECILREEIKRYGKPKEYLDIWSEFLEGKVL